MSKKFRDLKNFERNFDPATVFCATSLIFSRASIFRHSPASNYTITCVIPLFPHLGIDPHFTFFPRHHFYDQIGIHAVRFIDRHRSKQNICLDSITRAPMSHLLVQPISYLNLNSIQGHQLHRGSATVAFWAWTRDVASQFCATVSPAHVALVNCLSQSGSADSVEQIPQDCPPPDGVPSADLPCPVPLSYRVYEDAQIMGKMCWRRVMMIRAANTIVLEGHHLRSFRNEFRWDFCSGIRPSSLT